MKRARRIPAKNTSRRVLGSGFSFFFGLYSSATGPGGVQSAGAWSSPLIGVRSFRRRRSSSPTSFSTIRPAPRLCPQDVRRALVHGVVLIRRQERVLRADPEADARPFLEAREDGDPGV